MVKVKLQGTISSELLQKLKDIFEKENDKARCDERPELNWSQFIEMVLKKGLKQFENKR